MLNPEKLISLTTIKGLGPRRIRKLLQKFPDIDDVKQLTKFELCQVKGITPVIAENVSNIETGYGIEALENSEKIGSRYFTYWDEDYPNMLKTVYDAPVGIFVLGKVREFQCISVVGTRSPTQYGKKITKMITEQLVSNGIGIVSGFARGVDTISHRTTVQYGGYTMAVLGNGLDICYPGENRELRNQLIDTGCIISEFVPGTKPDAVNFPKRNRIISGLSFGTLVIEAGKKSGALLTAMNALDQNRDVYAIPGRVDSKNSIGCHNIIQQGAKLVQSVEDILNELQLPNDSQQVELLPDLTSREENIYSHLNSHKSIHIDDLCKKVQMNTPEVLSILLTLELKNTVIQLPGKYFQKS